MWSKAASAVHDGAMKHGARATALAASAALLALGGCGGSSKGASAPSLPSNSASSSTAPTSASSAAAPGGAADQVYLSIGDSYAAGYQPTGFRVGHTTTNGFAYQLVGAARAKGYDLTLVNVGCSGATTTSVLQAPGCRPTGLGPGAASYGSQTQADAAVEALQQHKGSTALITVSIGGNDITACALAPSPIPCLTQAVAKVKTNLTTLLQRLRAAAGPAVPIIGSTYPDVLLGGYVTGGATGKQLAGLSVTAFRSLVNPALKAAYEGVGGSFVDITAATGAYGQLTQTTTDAPYGVVPVPVAKVCELTFACQFRDIHPRTPGYRLIADAVVGVLPAHK
jgi:lysophospholipase L1-like esterase